MKTLCLIIALGIILVTDNKSWSADEESTVVHTTVNKKTSKKTDCPKECELRAKAALALAATAQVKVHTHTAPVPHVKADIKVNPECKCEDQCACPDCKCDPLTGGIVKKEVPKVMAPAAQVVKGTDASSGHTHTCKSCGTTWGEVGHSHNCPKCGKFENVQDVHPNVTYAPQTYYTFPSSSCANGQCGTVTTSRGVIIRR